MPKQTLRFSRFDAELNTIPCNARNNADLILKLRLGFRQINPAGGAANGTYHDYGNKKKPARKIIKWTAGEWAIWKNNFVRTAEQYWSGKFWLINNLGIGAFRDNGTIYIPNFYCLLDIDGRDATTGTFHHVIDVVRLDPSETWFGSHATLYDSKDTDSVQKGTDSKKKPIMQRAHVHEVGHLLGLGHVDIGKPHCPVTSNTNEAQCYGIADHDKNSVMGQGMQARPEHAQPWQQAIRGFARLFPASPHYVPSPQIITRVTARYGSLTPKSRRHYPMAKEQYEQGRLVT
jgi:hypothetical protein